MWTLGDLSRPDRSSCPKAAGIFSPTINWVLSGYSLLINFTCWISFFFFFYLQRSNRAAVVTPGSHPMANGRGRAFVTETSCTSSACPPLSWWGRRTSPVKRTTSGRPRNPAASVSLSDASCVFGVPVSAHKYGCSRRRGYGALHNKWPDYPHSWPCILKQWMLLLFN